MPIPARRPRPDGRPSGRALLLAGAAGALAALALAATAIAPAGAAFARSSTLSDLTFVSPTLGFVRVAPSDGGAGTLYRTLNGGGTWSVVSRHIEATSLVFRNRTDGEALVPVAGSAGMCHVGLTAVATTDGGVTWHAPAAIRAEDSPVALAFEGSVPFLLNASCAGAYAALQAPTGASAWSVIGKLALTAAQSRTYGFASVAGATTDGSFAVVGYSTYGHTGAPFLRAYRHLGGKGLGAKAWQALSIDGAGLPGHLVAVSFANARSGVVATENAAGNAISLWATANAGRTWTRALTLTGENAASLDLVNGAVAYATVARFTSGGATSLLYKSLNGGRTWVRLSPPA